MMLYLLIIFSVTFSHFFRCVSLIVLHLLALKDAVVSFCFILTAFAHQKVNEIYKNKQERMFELKNKNHTMFGNMNHR